MLKQSKRSNPAVKRLIIAVAILAIIALTVILLVNSCNKEEYRVLTAEEIAEAVSGNDYASDEQRGFVDAALSLVGKVNYFWGGKSYEMGWNDAWGTPREVTSEGHSTTGTLQPYGLDCSGYVSWCFIQLGYDKSQMIEEIGNGTWNQWDKSHKIQKSEVKLGDLAFINSYPGASGNHIGICVGFTADGSPLIAHCSNTQNNVVVTTCGREFIYFRRPAFLWEVEG